MEIRRLEPGDEDVVAALATREPHTELLHDERTIFLVAFEDAEPIGFVLAHELPRRHDPRTKLLVYEIEVEEAHRNRGVGKGLMEELARMARTRGVRHGWVPADRDNEAAMALYQSVGGKAREVVELDFEY